LEFDYSDVLVASWNSILEKLERGEIILESEDDLRCHLFHECLVALTATDLKPAFPIHAEAEYFDMILGANDVAVELKFSKKEQGGYTVQKKNILRDLGKLKQSKAKSAYFGIVSEVNYFFKPESENYVDFESQGFSDKVIVVNSPKGSLYCLLARVSS
jgi:hypothetical protein